MFFFTADTHFGHRNVLKLCNRPFENVEEMDETLIENWNSRITGRDTICIVGDMFFACDNPETILKRLHGKKRLIVGNHDSSWMSKFEYQKYFESVDDLLQISDGKHSLIMCHYPLLTWMHQSRSFMIHGHIHANTDMDFWPCIKARNNLLNAGTDLNNFTPVTFNELLENNRIFKETH